MVMVVTGMGPYLDPCNVTLIRALWPLFDGIWGVCKGSWGGAGTGSKYLNIAYLGFLYQES